jgi:hypothetical protein
MNEWHEFSKIIGEIRPIRGIRVKKSPVDGF